MTVLLPYNETERVATLRKYAILDTAAEKEYDEIASFAACLCGTPIAAISLIDAERQWFKAGIGLPSSETPRDVAFCSHTILQQGPMIVSDARADRRFANNPQVTGDSHIRFYAGVPLLSADGLPLGTLCVVDRVPRHITTEQVEALRTLGRQVERLLALRRSVLSAAEVPLRAAPSEYPDANPVEIQAVIAAWQQVERQYQEARRSTLRTESDGTAVSAEDGEDRQNEGLTAKQNEGLTTRLEWIARGLQARTEALLNGSAMRLLYVDDDGLDREAVRRALKRSDLHADVREVETYAAALAALKEETFDCLLVDYSLPDGDGLSLLLEIQAAGCSVPVVMLTGRGDERLAVEAVRAGAADYLPKPDLSPLLLSHSLRSAVRVHLAELERAAQARAEAAEHAALLERQKAELARALREAEERADHDPLTGLLNHRVFHRRLAAEAVRAEREGTTLAVVVLDLGNFTFFNDIYGYDAGDDLLRYVADRLRAACRPYDSVSRFGGDEFALLLPNVGAVSAAEIEARLEAELREMAYRLAGQETSIPVTTSMGVALFPQSGLDRSAVVRLADERLRRAKTGGVAETEADQVRRHMRHSLDGFSMLDALVAAVDNKDRYTHRHSEDVMEYSLMIAGELGLDEQEQETVSVAALLHDVGKIGVPDAILRKPGKLTDEEFEAIKQHPAMGTVMVGAVPGLEKALDAVRHHHERWDGTGYPGGLRGDETPLIARLMAVADAFSAMRTDRPYRKGLDRDTALSILDAGAGSQWDPKCVAAFLSAHKKARKGTQTPGEESGDESRAQAPPDGVEAPLRSCRLTMQEEGRLVASSA